MAKGLLFASFDFSAAQADEFHDWYDLEHIPERLRVPGFINAERWIGDENPNVAVATYDLDTLGVLQSAPYRGDRRRQRVGLDQACHGDRPPYPALHRRTAAAGRRLPHRPAPARLLVASMNVDPAAEPEFNEWYNAEHLPQLGAVPGVLCARRYSSSAADRERKYLALYHLTGPDVARSATRGRRRPTRRGPSACVRISAICWCSAASGIVRVR